ncbi:MAG: Ig-like domain-containing protein [Spirochaetaceae bacterium]|nr:Ig-like domain-containing protein [Spirochaetaceae bacterium]
MYKLYIKNKGPDFFIRSCPFFRKQFRLTALFLAVFLAASCGFADLRPVPYTTVPERAYGVLYGSYAPVLVRFGTEMVQSEAEKLISISFREGPVSGDLGWDGNTLYFTPRSPWSAGLQYTLSLNGNAFAKDGRELRVSSYMPFYAEKTGALPFLRSFSPGDGISVGVNPEEGALLVLEFSESMDRKSTEYAFTWDCPGDKDVLWYNDDRSLELRPKEKLNPWTAYHWSISTRAKSRDGIPLAGKYEGTFITNRDTLIPAVERCFPLAASGPAWVETGGNIGDGLGSGGAIGVGFTKAMNRESMLRSLRFEPGLAGRTEQLDDRTIVFIPEQEWARETVYTLTVSRDTQDLSGLKLGEDHRVFFTPDLPYLDLRFIAIDTYAPFTGADLADGNCLRVSLSDPLVLRLTLGFSLNLSGAAITAAFSRISLTPFFPPNLPAIALRSASLESEDALSLEWEGLAGGAGHYYRLFIPGGKGGIHNGGGAFFREDRCIYIEVLP